MIEPAQGLFYERRDVRHTGIEPVSEKHPRSNVKGGKEDRRDNVIPNIPHVNVQWAMIDHHIRFDAEAGAKIDWAGSSRSPDAYGRQRREGDAGHPAPGNALRMNDMSRLVRPHAVNHLADDSFRLRMQLSVQASARSALGNLMLGNQAVEAPQAERQALRDRLGIRSRRALNPQVGRDRLVPKLCFRPPAWAGLPKD